MTAIWTGLLVLANSDGTQPQVFGAEGEDPWAGWSPDGAGFARPGVNRGELAAAAG